MDECNQCEGHVRLIREVQAALIRAGKDPVAGYVGRFAECIDEMAQEIRHLTSRRSRAADVCVYCGQPIGFKTKTCASGGACTAASLTRRYALNLKRSNEI